ncbi:MAG: TIGR03086 family metal-binding protein [Nocardioides sp.]|uniref:TIGR03086 family metal-binding protein n=1 Tax=Nocardioides sp. TaxID=35761 RepID=UPI0039E406F1
MNSNIIVFRDRADRFSQILRGVGDRWDAPSPCVGWSVRDVADHVLTTQRDFLAQHDLDLGPVPATDDLVQRWEQHRAAAVAVLEGDGVAEREYDGYFGRTTLGDTIADFYGWDLVIHGWDIARATGQEWELSDAEAASMGRTADGWGPALYSEGVCGPAVAVPEDASAADRLLGRLGRDPQWTPA